MQAINRALSRRKRKLGNAGPHRMHVSRGG
jgi:hypothetical protein